MRTIHLGRGTESSTTSTVYGRPRDQWRVPLHHNVTNLNTDTILLDAPTGTELLNSAYTTPFRELMLGHIMS